MEKKYVIINLYYIKKYKIVDIAKEINVSKQFISKIIKDDIRYLEEKERRKKENQRRQNLYRKEFMKRKRKSSENERMILNLMHDQASKELSTGKNISNRAFRDWNSSIYKYNNNKKTYDLKKGIVVSKDVPKRINW